MIRAILAASALAFPAMAESPMPFNVGGAFELVDQSGAIRTQAEPEGRPQILFFGYANCQEICSAALPLMAEVTDAVRAKGIDLQPVMITVDPVRDTVDTLGPTLARIHEGFVGLTGDDAALQVAYDAYAIETKEVFVDPEFGPVLAHGSFLYLLDGDGVVQSLLPPILDPDALEKIVLKYSSSEQS